MKVKITKPDSTLFEGDAKLIQLPGTGGVRLVTELNETQTFDIRGGVVKGQNNDILILVQ